MFIQLLSYITTILNNEYALFSIKCCATLYYFFLMIQLLSCYTSSSVRHKYITFAGVYIFISMLTNTQITLFLAEELSLITIREHFKLALTSICWILLPLNLMILLYVISRFVYKKVTPIGKTAYCVGSLLSSAMLALAMWDIAGGSYYQTPIIRLTYFYICFIYVQATIIAWKGIYFRRYKLPKIKREQLRFLTFYLLVPHALSNVLSISPFHISYTSGIQDFNIGLKSITTVLLIGMLHYCAKNLLKLRFLNVHKQVSPETGHHFTTDFKPILEQMSSISTMEELKRIVIQFITKTYHLPTPSVAFYVREHDDHKDLQDNHQDHEYARAEEFLQTYIFHDTATLRALHEEKIVIQDEVAFSYEYHPTHARSVMLDMCRQLEIAAFIPIFRYDRIVGYILIEDDARKELFTQREQDELLMFAHYLSNVIHLLAHRDVHQVMAREKRLQDQLHQRERELEQYRESIRSCVQASYEKSIGVILYKSRYFYIRNKTAHEMMGIDPNRDKGTSLARELRNIVNRVETRRQRQTVHTRNMHQQSLTISATTELEGNGIIITLHYPEVADTINQYAHILGHDNAWNYLLYLETTQAGHELDHLIPGKSEYMLQVKMSVLQAALSRCPVLISGAHEDALEVTSFIHKASDRDMFHRLTLEEPERNGHVIHALFGTASREPFLDFSQLEQLHEHGTLCLENMHFLSFATQKQLAHYITYGHFQKENSEYKLMSDVRIIGTTSSSITALLEQGTLLPSFHKSIPHVITLPDVSHISMAEFCRLVDAILYQLMPQDVPHRLLAWSNSDYTYLRRQGVQSIHELRYEIAQHVRYKSSQHTTPSHSEKATIAQEPTLFRAAQLGKEALKDREMMIFLWNMFKSQNKIATLLNVNRSSVNRRIKQYQLHYESHDVHNVQKAISRSPQNEE